MRCPDKNRTITFRKISENIWRNGEVQNISNTQGTNKLVCTVLLETDDVIEVDLASGKYEWKYLTIRCDICKYNFHTKNGLRIHKSRKHKDDNGEISIPDKSVEINEVTYSENFKVPLKTAVENDNPSDDTSEEDFHRRKIRFQELCDEIDKNKEWRESLRKEDTILYQEVRENQENMKICEAAKEKELENFDRYDVYQEVKDEGQRVIGTRFVLSEKSDGSIKARFVIKGFQEESIQSDSPTASRETLKVFCTVSANEKWEVVASDVRAAFLQSDDIDREIFVEPPPQRKKGLIWKA